jgi:tetratricopeptide (TPR) repeat protein
MRLLSFVLAIGAIGPTVPAEDMVVQPAALDTLSEGKDAVEKRLRSVRDLLNEPLAASSHNASDLASLRQELGSLLMASGRFNEAMDHWLEEIQMQPAGSPSDKLARVQFGIAAFYVGRDDEALQAFEDGAEFNTAMSSYFAGLLLERLGRPADALRAYDAARLGPNKWFGEPVYRAAALFHAARRTDEAFQWLARLSRALGRDLVIARLRTDGELQPLHAALVTSGRLSLLEEKGPIRGKDLSFQGLVSVGRDDEIARTPKEGSAKTQRALPLRPQDAAAIEARIEEARKSGHRRLGGTRTIGGRLARDVGYRPYAPLTVSSSGERVASTTRVTPVVLDATSARRARLEALVLLPDVISALEAKRDSGELSPEEQRDVEMHLLEERAQEQILRAALSDASVNELEAARSAILTRLRSDTSSEAHPRD